MRETFQTPGPVVLELRVPSGTIDVETADTAETVVELTGLEDDELRELARVELRETGAGYRVLVEVDERGGSPFRFLARRSVRLDVQAPEEAELHVKSGSADVAARGRLSTVAVQSGSGDVELDSVTGDAVVKSSSGDVSVREAGGDAVIATASGDVDLGRVGGEAQVRSASGDVLISEAGTAVTVQTASGDQQVDCATEGSVVLQSASGDMSVGIRRGSRLWVDARSVSGETSSELDVSDAPVDDDGPLVEVRATAMSGDIRILRA